MTPCACHCAACRAAGHGNGWCVVLRKGLIRLFHGKADIVDLVFFFLRHYYRGLSGWDTARLDAEINCVQCGPAGDVIAAGDRHGRIHFICAQTGEKILSPLDAGSFVNSVHFSPDGHTVSAGCSNGTVQIIDVATAEVKRPLQAHNDWVTAVAWSPCGQWLASGGGDKMVNVYDAKTFEVKWPLKVDGVVYSVAISPDGTTLAAGLGGPSNSVLILDAQSGEIKSSLTGHRYFLFPDFFRFFFLSVFQSDL